MLSNQWYVSNNHFPVDALPSSLIYFFASLSLRRPVSFGTIRLYGRYGFIKKSATKNNNKIIPTTEL